MTDETNPILASYIIYTGYYHDFVHRISKSGEEKEEVKEERIKKILGEERKRVQPVYNIEGEIIEYNKYGRHLNVKG